jgi:hypothetical protein
VIRGFAGDDSFFVKDTVNLYPFVVAHKAVVHHAIVERCALVAFLD